MPRKLDFNESQAQDLATCFLGPGWVARYYLAAQTCILSLADPRTMYQADNWRSAFRAAGVKLPYRVTFASTGKHVHQAGGLVCVCKSANFAVRTANALNAYEPDDRGQ